MMGSYNIISAQQEYMASKNLVPFEGIWEYKTANETFTIVLYKGFMITNHLKSEQVHGGYKYIKNNTIIGDYIVSASNIYTNSMAIWGDNSGNIPSDAIYGYFKDKKLDKEGEFMLTLSPGKTNEARWQLFDVESVYFIDNNGISNAPPEGFSVPADVVMTKISSTVPAP
jgi:hypothetical protein